MCNLFLSQDPQSYRQETRPIRLHGHLTSVRIEAAFWAVLKEIAEAERMSLSQFCSTLYDEVNERQGEVGNFASFLRVTCLHYLRNQDLHALQVRSRHSEQASAVAREHR